MTQDYLFTLISSSVASALFGAAVAGLFNLRSKRNEYINDYYKLVIRKRFESYEIVELIIKGYKTVLFDGDNRPYYIVFDDDSNWENAYAPLATAQSNAVWLSDKVLDLTKELNSLLFILPSMKSGIREFGKVHYIQISKLRDALEIELANDLLTLHAVEKFLMQKKRKKHGFYEVNLTNVILGSKNKNKVVI